MPVHIDFCFDWDFLNAIATFCAVLVSLSLARRTQKIVLEIKKIRAWDREPIIKVKVTAYNKGNVSVHIEDYGIFVEKIKRYLPDLGGDKTIEPLRSHSFLVDSYDFFRVIRSDNYDGKITLKSYVRIYAVNSLGKYYYSKKMRLEDWYSLDEQPDEKPEAKADPKEDEKPDEKPDS